MVYGFVSGANRDPRAYERAGEFVIDRERNNHMGFANGPHRCLGMHLARRELQLAVEEWLRIIPGLPRRRRRAAGRARRRRDDDADEASAGVGGAVVKLTVDGPSCMGMAACYLMAPDLLGIDDEEGYVTIRDQTIDVPDDQVEAAEDAAGTALSRRSGWIPRRLAPQSSGRSVGVLRRRAPAARGDRGRPVRRAAHALRPRARRRRPGLSEDQVGHAHLREDRAASGLPVLRRRPGRRRRDPGGAARPLPRDRLRRRHVERQGLGIPGERRPAWWPPPSSSPGTTATPPTPTRRSTSVLAPS